MVLGDAFTKLSGLHTANLSWQTRVGKPKLVCVNGTKTGGKRVCKLLASNRNVVADCFYAVHTHQLEFANFSLPCEGRFRDVCMDFEPYFKAHNLVSVHPKSIILGQMINLNMIFHVVMSVYRLVKI